LWRQGKSGGYSQSRSLNEARDDTQQSKAKTMTRHVSAPKSVSLTEQDPRWAAVRARDPRADGKFYYSVKTSGVYCRPSCAARLAKPKNVRFHKTRIDAERAGFRPCKRCKPDQDKIKKGPATAQVAI
jgi:Metal binding domain of Ada